MKRLLLCSALLLSVAAHAKLPTPVLTEEAKAKAAEAAARTAWAAKQDAYKLCVAQDRAAAAHQQTARAKGLEMKPAVATPSCADPGTFAYVPPKPIEAAGAHSPAATAISPPNTNAPASAVVPKKP
ncbi:MAG: hypothetical protein Q8K24_15775 [Hydrogenophaga sp.]|nr:hypothetical protein [Hydrogenophaga sp.]